MIIFDSIRFLLKKITKLKFFFKKNRNRVKPTGSNRLVSVRFFRAKTGLNRFGSVFSVLAWFFLVWLGLLGFSGLARFGSFFSGFFGFWFGLVFSVFCL